MNFIGDVFYFYKHVHDFKWKNVYQAFTTIKKQQRMFTLTSLFKFFLAYAHIIYTINVHYTICRRPRGQVHGARHQSLPTTRARTSRASPRATASSPTPTAALTSSHTQTSELTTLSSVTLIKRLVERFNNDKVVIVLSFTKPL